MKSAKKRKFSRWLIFLIVMACGAVAGLVMFFVTGWIGMSKCGSVTSPDGKFKVVITCVSRSGPIRIPEPPEALGNWIQMKVIKTHGFFPGVFDTGFEKTSNYRRGSNFDLDVLWAPDSSHVAYRLASGLRLIGVDGKVACVPAIPQDFAVSSFQWMDDNRLLVVAKKVGKCDPDWYEGYLWNSREIMVFVCDTNGDSKELFRHPLDGPVFTFRSLDFKNVEITADGTRVAFCDGSNLCVYDAIDNKLISTTSILRDVGTERVRERYEFETGTIAYKFMMDGVWWIDSENVVAGLNLLNSPDSRHFYHFNVASGTLTEVSQTLLPVWKQGSIGIEPSSWEDSNWCKSGINAPLAPQRQ